MSNNRKLAHSRRSWLSAMDKGFDSLTLNPAPALRSHRVRIQSTNTVAEAWRQTGNALRVSMKTVKENSSRSAK